MGSVSRDESEEDRSAPPQRTRALEKTDTASGMTIPRSPFCLPLLGPLWEFSARTQLFILSFYFF